MDFLDGLAQRNLDFVLRQIFDRLSEADLANCRKVAPGWGAIIDELVVRNRWSAVNFKWLHGDVAASRIKYEKHLTRRSLTDVLKVWRGLKTLNKACWRFQRLFLIKSYVVFVLEDWSKYPYEDNLLVFEGDKFKTRVAVPDLLCLQEPGTWNYYKMHLLERDNLALLVSISRYRIYYWCYSLPSFKLRFSTYSPVIPSGTMLMDVVDNRVTEWFVHCADGISRVRLDVKKQGFVTERTALTCLSDFYRGLNSAQSEDGILEIVAQSGSRHALCFGRNQIALVDMKEDNLLLTLDMRAPPPFVTMTASRKLRKNLKCCDTCVNYADRFVYATVEDDLITVRLQRLESSPGGPEPISYIYHTLPRNWLDNEHVVHPYVACFNSRVIPRGCLLGEQFVALCLTLWQTTTMYPSIHGWEVVVVVDVLNKEIVSTARVSLGIRSLFITRTQVDFTSNLQLLSPYLILVRLFGDKSRSHWCLCDLRLGTISYEDMTNLSNQIEKKVGNECAFEGGKLFLEDNVANNEGESVFVFGTQDLDNPKFYSIVLS